MQKSYAKLIKRRRHIPGAQSVIDLAIAELRRHNCCNVICSLCDNDQQTKFEVTDADGIDFITEVKCKRCKQKSYVCYCKNENENENYSTHNGFEHSYKENSRNREVRHSRKSICIYNVMKSTVALLRRNNDRNVVCSCGNNNSHQLTVVGVDRLGFITGVQCSLCQKELDLSPIEESYVVQTLYHGQSDQALHGEHAAARVLELCNLLRRHSLYSPYSICPERNCTDRECCRVTAINKESGKVTEVEFEFQNGSSLEVQRLQITCWSCCYYRQDNQDTPCSRYESTYKEVMRRQLQGTAGETQRRAQIHQTNSEEAILSCTVLAANAAILRRHSIGNKLCHRCKNDDHDFLDVVEVDIHGFITRVQCTDTRCRQPMSTVCHRSRFYYEEIDECAQLERGDHIAWHRNLAFWHHAIVTQIDDRTVTVAHYDRSRCSVIFRESTKSRQDLSSSCSSGTAYHVTYDDCYTNKYTALRAEKSIGEKHYNLFNKNCEHSSHWCKTGLTRSDQMRSCFSSLGKFVLAMLLRILNIILLVVFQVIHEKREGIQIDRKAFELFEHIITGTYMLLVFLLFTAWSLHTECNKLKKTTDNNCWCNRPPRVVTGLYIRIITRELIAAAVPFLLIFFEDYLLALVGIETLWIKQVTVSFTLLGVTVFSYLLGALIGTWLEHIRCRCYCVVTSTAQREPINDHSQGEA